jgi:hypothetical protein
LAVVILATGWVGYDISQRTIAAFGIEIPDAAKKAPDDVKPDGAKKAPDAPDASS